MHNGPVVWWRLYWNGFEQIELGVSNFMSQLYHPTICYVCREEDFKINNSFMEERDKGYNIKICILPQNNAFLVLLLIAIRADLFPLSGQNANTSNGLSLRGISIFFVMGPQWILENPGILI